MGFILENQSPTRASSKIRGPPSPLHRLFAVTQPRIHFCAGVYHASLIKCLLMGLSSLLKSELLEGKNQILLIFVFPAIITDPVLVHVP